MQEEYGVRGLYLGHTDDVRAVCVLSDGAVVTGGRDSCVKIWRLQDGIVEAPAAEIPTTSWVMSLCSFGEGVSERFPLGGFAIGCRNGDVLIVAAGDAAVGTVLSGHTAPVCSLSCSGGLLASGSWDETMRLWSIDDERCLQTRGGHENQVCCLLLPNGDVVTGSTGIPFQDPVAPSVYGVIEHKLRVWRDGQMITTMTDHEAGIRALALVSHDPIVFASASNDGSVKLWNEAYTCIHTCKLGDEMVLAIAAGPAPEQWTAADTSGTVFVGDVQGNIRTHIRHPKSLWSVATLPATGDIVTAGEDRIVRVWTADPARKLPQEEVRRAQETAIAAKQGAQAGGQGQTPAERLTATLPTDSTRYRGEDGGIALFLSKTGVLEARRYDRATQQWQLIGELQEPVLIEK